MLEELLDDGLLEEEKELIRSPRIKRLEKLIFIGLGVMVLLAIWSASVFSWLFFFGGWDLIRWLLGLGTVYWWRKCSLKYDQSPHLYRIEIPGRLTFLRLLLLLSAFWSLYYFYLSIDFVFGIALGKESLWAPAIWLMLYFFSFLLNGLLAVIYLFYLKTTQDAAKRINAN